MGLAWKEELLVQETCGGVLRSQVTLGGVACVDPPKDRDREQDSCPLLIAHDAIVVLLPVDRLSSGRDDAKRHWRLTTQTASDLGDVR